MSEKFFSAVNELLRCFNMEDIKKIYGAQPYFASDIENILQDIKDILITGQLTQGKHLSNFENEMSKYVGTRYAVAVSSGGVALELALQALNIEDKEVIVPTQTFIASAFSVVRAGGKPILVDVNHDTLFIDPDEVKKKLSKKTVGIMPVHMFGLSPPKLVNEILNISKTNNLFVIEDAAHAHGASVNGKKAGNLGDVGCFSFYATKVITTGEGGVVTTNRKDIFEKILELRNHGRSLRNQLFDCPGNNFRLPEIPAVLGKYQVLLLDKIVTHRNLIANIYKEELDDAIGVELLKTDFPESSNAYWRFPLYLDKKIDRMELQKRMWSGCGVRITWMYEPLCHLQPFFVKKFKHNFGDFPVAEDAIKKLINLPTHCGISKLDAHRITGCLKKNVKCLFEI